jgi:hypothetical protein
MSSSRSTFRELTAVLAALVALAATTRAHAQACCAGSSAITPGRLAVPEDALVGVLVRGQSVVGAHDTSGHYAKSGAGDSELDFEQALIGTLRVLRRAQVSVVVPFVETRRRIAGKLDTGGGIGDVNLSGRYDFTLAGASKVVPGIALLLGVTLPTGRAPESSTHPFAADATGIGAFQGSLGLAVEQTFGSWLVNVSAFVSQRAARDVMGVHSQLGTLTTLLAAGGYTFDNDVAVALVATYAYQANGRIDGETQPNSGRALTTLTLAGLVPIGDTARIQGGLYLTPPIDHFARDQPTPFGLTLAFLRSFS